jgi:hypothetical protein
MRQLLTVGVAGLLVASAVSDGPLPALSSVLSSHRGMRGERTSHEYPSDEQQGARHDCVPQLSKRDDHNSNRACTVQRRPGRSDLPMQGMQV